MGFRCHVCDSDLLNLLVGLRRDEFPCLPATPPGVDGVVQAGALTEFTSASNDFTTGWGGTVGAGVPIGTCVNLVGEGFYYVTALGGSQAKTKLYIAADTRRQHVVETMTAGTAKRFVVGGFSETIRVAYEELYRSVGMYKDTDGVYKYKATLVPSTWHGADDALLYIALHAVLLGTMTWKDGVYDYWLQYARERSAQMRDNIVWQYDEDADGTTDLVTTEGQTRLVR